MTILKQNQWLTRYLDSLDPAARARLMKYDLRFAWWGDPRLAPACLVSVARGYRTSERKSDDPYGLQHDVILGIPYLFDRIPLSTHGRGVGARDVQAEIRAYLQQKEEREADRFLSAVYSNRPAIKEPAMRKRLVAVGLALLLVLI